MDKVILLALFALIASVRALDGDTFTGTIYFLDLLPILPDTFPKLISFICAILIV
jgi:hypothetical protein